MRASGRRLAVGVVVAVAVLWAGSAPTALGQQGANPTADAISSYGPAVWMRIPRIAVDAAVSDVQVEDGYYQVPWFDVGHHFDSANPGEPGNSVFDGHVLTIDAGRVFQRLKELQQGDAVYVYTPGFRTDWAVTSVFAVADDDDSFLAPADAPLITLYTCTGSFNPLERTFDERLVVVGQLVQVVPRDNP